MAKAVDEEEFEENPPDPAATIESLRSLGYSTEAAIADLVDNSIAASADRVEVQLHWNGDESWCAVVDNGSGMSEDALKRAMRIGSSDPLADRSSTDLGRFGFGLKTASFSQARVVTVASRRKAGHDLHCRVWDLDHVRASGRWLMRRKLSTQTSQIVRDLLGRRCGTVVLWQRLSSVDTDGEDEDIKNRQRDFLRLAGVVEEHLSMTFSRFLSKPASLQIVVNGQRVKPWDPFLSEHSATQVLPPEKLLLRGHLVEVQPYVLPHPSKLSASEQTAALGSRGWNELQGFFVYRVDRLISAGDWLGLNLPRDNLHSLSRIALDIPPALDREWSLNINKTSVSPPNALKKDLKRIAEATRARAKRTHTSRGGEVRPRNRPAVVRSVWRQTRSHAGVTFAIDRSHPLIKAALDDAGELKKPLLDLITVIEQTVPIPLLPVRQQDEVEAEPELDEATFRVLYSLSEQLYSQFLASGMTRADAIVKLERIEPFNIHTQVVRALTETS